MKVHSMQEIAETGSKPMQKATIPAEGTDARMMASTLAAEVMAYATSSQQAWQGFAVRLVRGTVDMRAAFVKVMQQTLKDTRQQNTNAMSALGKDGKPNPTKEQSQLAGKRVATATVYVSNLNVIANAFNSGGTETGLIHHHAEALKLTEDQTAAVRVEDIGFTVIYEYAKQFSEAKAGRKADPFLVKLGKWMDTIGKAAAEGGDEQAQLQYAEVLALVNKLQG